MVAKSTDRQSVIRSAAAAEAPTLTALAFRSKAYWGYDATFMEACREDLTTSADDILAGLVYVIEEAGRIVGFYKLRLHAAEEAELIDLFVEPDAIGRGYGKRLWQHAVGTARQLGVRRITFQSEPHAEGFYQAMGAERIGVSESTVFPGRMLPLMRFIVRQEGYAA
jgi:N-acetylglutamate synthase-like GNAT family acetyltransferase